MENGLVNGLTQFIRKLYFTIVDMFADTRTIMFYPICVFGPYAYGLVLCMHIYMGCPYAYGTELFNFKFICV